MLCDHPAETSQQFHFGQGEGLSRQTANDAKVKELIARIQKGNDTHPLLEASRTGNLEFVPHLRERLRHDIDKHNSLKEEAQMALAKLGQAEQLQVIYCRIATGNDRQVDNTIGELDYVGGWY